jgi:hypothetical protein
MNVYEGTKRLILTCLCLIFLAGCAGYKYTDKVDPVRLDQKVQKRSTKVYAQADDWRNSGVIVQKEASYQISARGRWHAGILCGWTSPSGVETHSSSCPPVKNVVKKWSAGALIGKIGENGEPFGVGYEYLFTPKEEGVLYLRINDCYGCTVDNAGFVDVAVVRTDAGAAGTEGQARVSPAGGDTGLRPVQGQKWAVIVGISSYKDSRIEGLRYAAADAQAFHNWLVSQKGGRYAPSRVRILLDSEATSRNIRNALFNWLGQVLEEDTVMIYFAGHGSPTPPINPRIFFFFPTTASTTTWPRRDSRCGISRPP